MAVCTVPLVPPRATSVRSRAVPVANELGRVIGNDVADPDASVLFLPFSTQVAAPQRFDIPPDGPGPTLARIGSAVSALVAAGDTDLYDAVVRAYQLAGEPDPDDPYTTIVLLTDGERTVGRSFDDFRAYWQTLSPPARQVPVFALLFGENNQAEMTALAQLTNGKTFDARTGSLASAFKEIRGYQ